MPFLTVSEFEQHMEGWLLKCRHDFSKGEVLALKMLMQYAKQFPGVCHKEISRILASIQKEYDCFGISRDTFKRLRRKADALGILPFYETVGKDDGRDCNLYVFHPYSNFI